MKKMLQCRDMLKDLWAKSPAVEGRHGESLLEHTWESLCRLRDLVSLRPWLSDLCDSWPIWPVLFWSVIFHDCGKAANGFQDMLRGSGRWPHRHEVLSLAFLDWISPVLSEDAMTAVAATIASHHKDARELAELYPPGLSPEDDPCLDLINAIDEATVSKLHCCFQEIMPSCIESLGFDELGVIPPPIFSDGAATQNFKRSGVEQIRKWLRKYQHWARDLKEGRQPETVVSGILSRGFMVQTDHVASARAGPLLSLNLSRDSLISASDLKEESLYEHQRKAQAVQGSAILIAPTGSGKTEAALLWASGQRPEWERVPRLFYVLPYQASMNAMFDRLNTIFHGQVGLLHSRSLLALYKRFMEQDSEPEIAAQRAKWARSLSMLLYHPVQIFSPYQMLKTAYQLKGYEAILADYAGALFIFDEIHAYEPDRLAMILELVRFLKEKFESRFLVMSATLPSVITEQMDGILRPCERVCASEQFQDSYTRHRLEMLSGEIHTEASLSLIGDAFRQENSVLVTCNTVACAQEVYSGLRSSIPPSQLILLHGQLNGRDRLTKEQQILRSTGLKSRDRNPVVVVSTQVVEVSLNIDLDILFTEPAPLEALLQRMGRVNRNRRVELAPVYVFDQPVKGKVYLPALVQAALDVLRKHAHGRPLQESAVGDWLDEVYSGDILAHWSERYTRAAHEFREAFLRPLRPFSSDEELAHAFDRLFDGTEVLPKSLAEEYFALCKEQVIEASQLLVPISWRRLMQIKKANLFRSGDGAWPPIVDIPYSPELGLSKVTVSGTGS